MDNHRYESMWIDFIGSILVEQEVAERCPKGDSFWPEIGLFLEAITAEIDRSFARALKSSFGRYLLSQGLNNIHLGLQYLTRDENEELVEQILWIELVHSSIDGKPLRRIIVVRSDPPFEFEQSDDE